MKKVLKKSLSVLLAIAMIFSSAYVGLGEIDFGVLLAVKAEAASVDLLTFELNSDGESYYVKTCDKSVSGEIIIPETYNGLPVTGIGEHAFNGCWDLTAVTIPDSVTTIGSNAFGCTGISSIILPKGLKKIEYNLFSGGSLDYITIPDGVTSIGDGAFAGCGLGYVNIPDSVTSIGSTAFYECNLESIEIPDSVTYIDGSAFLRCRLLESINVDENNQCYSSVDGVLFDKSETVLKIFPAGKSSAYTVPDGVRRIGEEAFYGCENLTSITIPVSVTSVGYCAFGECTSITDVYYDGTEADWANISIGSANSELTSATIHYTCVTQTVPEELVFTLNSDGDSYSVTDCDTSASGEIVIPSTYNGLPVTSIGGSAFYYCKKLTSITIPDSVTSIGYEAFSNCTSLVSITIPDSVTIIGEYAFSGCKSLESITIPGSVTRIDGPLFSNCLNLKSIILCYGVEDLGYETFAGCEGLESITIPGSISSVVEYAFGGCTNLKTVIIENGVTEIEERAFYNCSSLESITIPSSVAYIGSNTFYDCTSLTSIIIPDDVTSINNSTFYNCTSLASITIPNGVTYIGSNAFYNCTSLTSIAMPDSVDVIENNSFRGCENLTIEASCHSYAASFAESNNIAKKVSHSKGKWITKIESTCTASGLKNLVCEDCNATLEEEKIPVTAHNCGDWIVLFESDCESKGCKYKKCEDCQNIIEIETVPAAGHAYGDWVIDEKATCESKGIRRKVCATCEDEIVEIILSTGHDYEVENILSMHPHTTTYKCSCCESTKTENPIFPDCIECIYGTDTPIKETGNTKIDFDNRLIHTSVKSCNDIADILSLSETAITIPVASHIFGNYEFYGTGTIVTVFDGDNYIGDFTLIVEGDVNGDSVCDVIDCAQVARASNGYETFEGAYAMAADSNSDDSVDINDYQDIVNKALAG